MKEIVELPAVRRPPDESTVLRLHGIPAEAQAPPRWLDLLQRALELYESLAEPRGLYAEIDAARFRGIYRGEGRNAERTPLEAIFPRAERLALFAATLGDAVSRKIGELFAGNEPALGYLLDSIASERADRASVRLGERFRATLTEDGTVSASTSVLAYSPGYCGWHVTGQRRLFGYLQPEQIDITLNASCLMQPLKSVSGVLVAGPGQIHDFDNDFDFCDSCATHECRWRIASVIGRRAARPNAQG